MTVRFIDTATGYVIRPKHVTLDSARSTNHSSVSVPDERGHVTAIVSGQPSMYVQADGYRPASITLGGAGADILHSIYLTPLDPPARLSEQYIHNLRSPNWMLIVGHVVDEESGLPLAEVEISTAPGRVLAKTDRRGYFVARIPLDGAHGNKVAQRANVTFHAPGYRDEVRSGLAVWGNGDWIFRIRLMKGYGEIIRDDARDHSQHTDIPEKEAVSDGSDPESEAFTSQSSSLDIQAASANVPARIPRYIRVSTGSGIDYVPFDFQCTGCLSYVTSVLPPEWPPFFGDLNNGLGMNALYAGSIAVRSYGTYFFNHPASTTYDICGTDGCQVYNPSMQSTNTDAAVQATLGKVLVDSGGLVPKTEYSKENNNYGCGDGYSGTDSGTAPCISDPVCTGTYHGGSHGRGMCQDGSGRWASGYYNLYSTPHNPNGYPPRSWDWILSHYYPSLTVLQGQVLLVNDRVQIFGKSSLPVRECSGGGIGNGVLCPQIGSKTNGSTGRIVAGPTRVTADGYGYTWWRIQWDGNNLTGWSAENWITHAASSADTGTVEVNATLDGAPWSGSVSYSVSSAATSFTGTSTGSHPNLPAGGYTVQYLSGGPGDFVEIVPASSQQLFAGGTISWTLKFTAMCTAGNSSLLSGTCSPPPPTLSVTLAANPGAGTAPLNDVDLTATVSGSATGTINYTFYCDRDDSGTNITPNPDAKYDGISTNPKTAANVCDYTIPDTYTAKVIVERGSLAAEARQTITVGGSSSPVPEVTTLAATSVTQASATFNATVHPKNSTTTFWFDYGTTTSVSQSTTPQTLAAATSASAVSISQGGLSCGQQYFYRIRASNTGGAATPGSILSFTTDACGGGGSQSVQLVADPSFEAGNNAWWVANPAFYIKGTPTFPNPRTGTKYAFLSNLDGSRGNNLSGGMISPSVTIPVVATDADLRFYYSITSDETTSTQIFDKVDVYLVRPGNQLNLITTISNLNENGTSYSLKSTDLSSSFYGDTVQIFFAGSTDGSFPTVFRIDDVTLEVDLPSASAPEVTTETADQVNASSARLNMTVNPHGANTEVWFDLEAGDSTPNDDTEHISIGAGSQNDSVSISVFGLQCGTLYYFQAEASNPEGSDSGSVRSFTTSPCAGSAPHADTDPAETITQTSATLTADVNPNGLSTQAWFAWGTTTNLGQETSHVSVGAGTGNVDFSQALSGLSCGTTYFFENHAANSAGQDDGVTLEFTTAACGPPPGYPINVTTGTADSITETSAVLHGSANPNGAPTNGFFAYGIWPNLDYTFTVPIGSGRTDQSFSILLTGLSCGSEYFFDAVANNDFGESNGGAKFFHTLDCGTSSPADFYTLTPCRLIDTRIPSDPNGPAITGNEGRIVVLAGKCGIPLTATAVSFNVTAVNPSANGFLSLYPASAAPPSTSTINFRQGQVRANNGIVGLRNGAITVFCGLAPSGSVDFVVDVNGYFQ